MRTADNRGYGEALRTGFLASRFDYVFFTDADLQFDMNELERFLQYAGTVDVVAGYRVNRQDPPSAASERHGWNFLVRVLFYVRCATSTARSSCSTAECCRGMDIESVGAMVNTELMVKLGRRGAAWSRSACTTGPAARARPGARTRG